MAEDRIQTKSSPRCRYCGKRDHVPEGCPNRTKCEHGVYVDEPETGNPPCWRCEVKPYRECGCHTIVFPEGGAAMTRDPLCPIHNETSRL